MRLLGHDRPLVCVLQLPGVNCEYETVRALEAVGLDARVAHWSVDPRSAAAAAALVLPGGFSYEDRLRAGAIAARERIVDVVVERAAAGVPVLGICNGAQVLAEAGLVPGRSPGHVEMALGRNVVAGVPRPFLSRWVDVRVRPTERSRTWTGAWPAAAQVPWPIAHAEGRFTSADPEVIAALAADELVPFAFADDPAPNGAILGAAGVMNRAGNVLALMPHPERATWLWQVAWDAPGAWGAARRALGARTDALEAAGPGRTLFASLALALGVEAAAA